MSKLLERQTAAETESNQKKRKNSTALWVLLAVFLILFLLSTVILCSRLYEMATQDKHAVDLGVSMDGELELFKIEYSNALEEVTVQGVNGEDLIAPGTTVDYDIRLRNGDDTAIDFVMTPRVEYLTGDPIPLQVKLQDNFGNYLLGSDTQWVSIDRLSEVVHKGTIQENGVFTYYLTWQWEFESGNDEYDTYLGNLDGKTAPGVEVSFLTEATVSPAQGHASLHLLDDSFGCCLCCYLVWVLLLVILVLLVWIWRLRKKLHKQEDTLEEYELQLRAHGISLDAQQV